MNSPSNSNTHRRAFLKLIGGGAVLIPLVGISGCAKKEAAAPVVEPAAAPVSEAPSAAAAPAPVAESAPPVSASTTPTTPAATPAGDLPHLDENDPVAKALGYRQDSSKVDAGKYPKHAATQHCAVCVQFKGAASDAWGGCNIFAGKQVNANGWCSAFAAKA
jgi:hypothetical protein